ncbi:DUF1064 domain-containing protein [Paucibacter soli]|uniref:DUF1064 domain-containing protein n=1 Tax=Paucibacter soli TaxID=3133433 RepID=UPI0030B275CC
MAVVTERMSAQQYRELLTVKPAAPGKRKNKFGNRRGLEFNGEKYDSGKELKHHQLLILAMSAVDDGQRVVEIERQVPFLLVEKQEGERAIKYIADFVVRYGNGRVEVQDTKSPPTRREKTYVIKRKLMLKVHNIRIQEF